MSNEPRITVTVPLDTITIWTPRYQGDGRWEIEYNSFKRRFVTPAEMVQKVADLVGVKISLKEEPIERRVES